MLKLRDVANILSEEKEPVFKAGERCSENALPDTELGISIDSRTIKKGEIFIALEGEKFDGHSFVADAFSKGAAAAVVCRKHNSFMAKKNHSLLIGVDDTGKALRKLAFCLREKFKGKVIAVTGSNGKTTTKEMIAHVLSSNFNVLKTQENQNNEIGVPLTIFKLTGRHEVIVFELGASKAGEIFHLKEMTKPDLGVITNIGQTHLEFLKTKENVLAAKLELLKDEFCATKTAFLNFDDENLKKAAPSLKTKIISFGIGEDCLCRAGNISLNNGEISFLVNGKYKVRLKTIGRHNVYSGLAAWAVGRYMGVCPVDIQKRLKSFVFPSRRLQFIKMGDSFVIDDSYNANPQSVKAALQTLSSAALKQAKIACLADMCELGEESEQLHYKIGFEAGALGIDTVIAFGRFSKFVIQGAAKGGVKNCVNAKDKNEALKWLLENRRPKQAILFKGSRAMKMEEVIKCFTNSYIN